MERIEPRDFETHTGEGAHAYVDGVWVGIGRESLFESHGKTLPQAVAVAALRIREAGQTALIVMLDRDGPPAGGVISVVRPTSARCRRRSGCLEAFWSPPDPDPYGRPQAHCTSGGPSRRRGQRSRPAFYPTRR